MTEILRIHAGTVVGVPHERLLVQKDYQTLITGDASCVGIWRMDVPDLLTLSGGKVTAIANWKPAGPTLVQATTSRQVATPVADEDLPTLKAVGTFLRASQHCYDLSGATFDAAVAHTTVCICKPSDYALSNQAAGVLGTTADRARLLATRQGVAPFLPVFRYEFGSSTASTTLIAAVEADYHRLIGSYDGSSLIPRLKVDGADVVVGAAASGEPVPTADIWGMSHSQNSFDGKIGMVGLFSADLLTDAGKATLLANLIEWMTLWVEG